MTDRVALITGGARGIGRALGTRLAHDGWSVAFCYREGGGEAAAAHEAAITASGGRALAIACDVSDPAACEAMVAQVHGAWGRIDALVHGAGPYHRVPLFEETLEGWHEMFDNNLHPVFWLSRMVAEHMKRQRWGRIVTFGMANADRMVGQPHVTGHFIAKVGVLILTRTLARILAPHGITANTISPGFIASGSAPDEELEQMAPKIPAGHVGSMDDTVHAACYLLSEQARYVNGANIQVSGGWGI